MAKMTNLTRKWFTYMCITAAIAFMLLINTNSYFADKHKIGWLYIVGGVAFALAAIFCLTKVSHYGGTKGSDK